MTDLELLQQDLALLGPSPATKEEVAIAWHHATAAYQVAEKVNNLVHAVDTLREILVNLKAIENSGGG